MNNSIILSYEHECQADSLIDRFQREKATEVQLHEELNIAVVADELNNALKTSGAIHHLSFANHQLSHPQHMAAVGRIINGAPLHSLDFSCGAITSAKAVNDLNENLQRVPTLHTLYMDSLGHNDTQAIAAMGNLLKDRPPVTGLHIGHFSADSPPALASWEKALRESHLTSFSFQFGADHTPQSAEAVGQMLKRAFHGRAVAVTVQCEDMDSPAAMHSLGALLRHVPGTTTVDLNENNIASRQMITALGAALHNSQASALSLKSNGLDTSSKLHALGEALSLSRVTHLDLRDCYIDQPELVSALSQALKKTPVTSLQLQQQDGDTTAKRRGMAALVKENPQLLEVKFDEELAERHYRKFPTITRALRHNLTNRASFVHAALSLPAMINARVPLSTELTEHILAFEGGTVAHVPPGSLDVHASKWQRRIAAEPRQNGQAADAGHSGDKRFTASTPSVHESDSGPSLRQKAAYPLGDSLLTFYPI